MIFFIIAASVMSLLIVSIHRLARHFGCELPLSSLVLCGLCAMVINFVIISVTPFLTKSYYYTAGAMITFAAFGTTCYNKYWLHRKLRLAGPASLPAMPQEQVQETQEIIQAEPVPAADMLPDEAQDEPAPSDDVPQAEHDEPVLTADVPQKEHGEPAIPQEIPSALPEEAAIPVNEPVPMPVETAVETDVETDQDADDELAATLAAMTTMDQLLDFAFEHNMQKDHPVALTAYMEALARYREDSYAPFIVVSIANIHKELGNYQAAIDSIQSAMDLPALLESESIRKQFEDTRLYLAATQKVLHKAGLGNISFKDIPKEYMSQIESIYNSRKSR
ncbi:hypothetical protein [Anaerovibrio sp.]|uniref:hypothetical protein n=1 Tax=Anaerovibrio sp. TaxID=1872532 RepID=UPI002631BC7F|nr:hypothetical protein [Anaerovibrio sp.]MDD6597885.1 hypothetical protein [Anaerovibrio sp.]